MKIYMASSWKNVNVVRVWAEFLREKGHEVDDFTDDSRGRFVFYYKDLPDNEHLNAITLLQHDQAQRAFKEDKWYIDWADVVFLLLPCGRSAHLEAGYAKGSGKKLIIFQEKFPEGEFDVMYCFADLITDDVNAVVNYLNQLNGGGKIVEVRFNNEPPTEYDYKHFDVVLENGSIQTFHYHKNNPIPTEEEMIGLAWDELVELTKKKWYEAIRRNIKDKRETCFA